MSGRQILASVAAGEEDLESLVQMARAGLGGKLAEIGVDMDRFPPAERLASWARVCPANQQSGGKRLSSATTKGNVWQRLILGEVAWAEIHERGSVFRARYSRLKPRLGARQAVVAILRQPLKGSLHILKTGELYRELGAQYYQTADPQRSAWRLTKRLERMGDEGPLLGEREFELFTQEDTELLLDRIGFWPCSTKTKEHVIGRTYIASAPVVWVRGVQRGHAPRLATREVCLRSTMECRAADSSSSSVSTRCRLGGLASNGNARDVGP